MSDLSVRFFLLGIGADPSQGIRRLAPSSKMVSLRALIADPGPRYNQVRQKSVHNAYNGEEGLYDQLIFWRVRSIELDIRVGKTGHDEKAGDWYVYHYDDWYSIGGQTTCLRLSDALNVLGGFHHAVPGHEVVTVFVDVKDKFDVGDHSAELFDALIESRLFGMVYAPADFRRRKASLREALDAYGWPALRQLRDKFIFVLTGDDDVLREYATSSTVRTAFVAPEIKHLEQSARYPHAVFFNTANDVLEKTDMFVTRCFVLDDSDSWGNAVRSGIHHLATNKVNSLEASWARTHDDAGYPFQTFGHMQAANPNDPGMVWSVLVDSGDIEGAQDSFGFVHCQDGEDRTYVAYLSTPSSHIDKWAKVGLMARATLEPGAPYFAVIRPADKHNFLVYYRMSPDQGTSNVDIPIAPPDTVDDDTLVFVKLDVCMNSRTAAAWASVSGRGDDWKLIHRQTFSQPLSLRGICASSHDSGPVQFIVGFIGAQPNLDKFAAISAGVQLQAVNDFFRWQSPS